MLTLAVLATIVIGGLIGLVGIGLGALSKSGWRLGFPLLVAGISIQGWWLILLGLATSRST